eukprot:10413904-Ditylum_brightwellii.AAC.1
MLVRYGPSAIANTAFQWGGTEVGILPRPPPRSCSSALLGLVPLVLGVSSEHFLEGNVDVLGSYSCCDARFWDCVIKLSDDVK